MKQKRKNLQDKRWKALSQMADSILRKMADQPTLDLRREYPPRFDRQRSFARSQPREV